MKHYLNYRSGFLIDVLQDYAKKNDTILEIGSGDDRNIKWLKAFGFKATGIDKEKGSAIEDVKEKQYDIIFTMSTLFLIPEENEWVFEKIARMAKKYIITIEGETTVEDRNLVGRNYSDVFSKYGFYEVESMTNVFNEYGVLRVLKHGTNN